GVAGIHEPLGTGELEGEGLEDHPARGRDILQLDADLRLAAPEVEGRVQGGLALEVAEEEVLLAAEEGGALPGREPAAGLERRLEEDGEGEGVLPAGREVPGVGRDGIRALRRRAGLEFPLPSREGDDAIDVAQGRRGEAGHPPASLEGAVAGAEGGH